jgi:hypothetical protein
MSGASALVLLLGGAGIYPADHWSAVTRLTTSNYKGFIKDQVDAGKTLFVRWIASEG